MIKQMLLLIMGWCLIGQLSLKAQDMERALTLQKKGNTLTKFITVEEALTQLEKKYDLTLIYESRLVEGRYIPAYKVMVADLQTALQQILTPLNLKYEQVGARSFTLLPRENPLLKLAARETITGTVIDASTGETLPGVNVIVKGTTTGTSTDSDGKYELIVESLQDTLVFSFVGFQTREVPINGRTEINVSMQPQTIAGEEVIVVGYGRQSSITTTGAISALKSENIEKTTAVTMGEAITGKIPGLATIQRNGEPGSSDPNVLLRGMGTMNNNSPLIVIDGVPNSQRAFMHLNPSNIANISVLKDASATAVYGVRGANGVIIIDTKRGEAGKLKISADASFGLQVPTKLPEFAGSYDWAKAYNEALRNDGNTSGLIPQSDIKHFQLQDQPLIYPDHNWVDETLANAASQIRSNINFSGGSENVRYFTSFGYLKQDGLISNFGGKTENFTYDRFNLRANSDISVTPTTDVSFTSSVRLGIKKEPIQSGAGFYRQTMGASPMSAYGMRDGKFYQTDVRRYLPYSVGQNPIEPVVGNGFHQRQENRLNINLDIRQKLKALSPVLEGLEFRTKMGYRSGYNAWMNEHGRGLYKFSPIYNVDAVNPDPNKSDSALVMQNSGVPSDAWWQHWYGGANRFIYWEAGLDYRRSFNKHDVGALLLYNQNKDYYPGGPYGNIPTGNVGMVGRITYSYDKQYMLEFNMGYNGSENFAKEQRFGWFPSVSAGWIVSKENFMQSISFVDHLKLRASYGIVGSDQAGGAARFIYIGDEYNPNVNQWYGYNFGNDIPEFRQGVHEASVGNEDVTWETARKQNYGLDIELLDNRLSLNVDYFYEYRNDILMTRNSAPTWLSMNLPPVNIGEVENRGFEVQMGWNDQIGDLFSYTIEGNISRAKNTILYMDEVPPVEPYQSRTGRSLNMPYGYIFDGFYNQEEIDIIANQKAQDVAPEDRQYAIPIGADVKPGDIKWKDLNNDGVIDNADQKVFGYPYQPQIVGGLNVELGYKGFDLSIGLQGAAEVSMDMQQEYNDAFGSHNDRSLWKPLYENRWTPEKAKNGTAKFPRLTFVNDGYNRRASDFWNRNASYLRIKRAELGYRFDVRDLKNLRIQQLRIYVRGLNLFTLQKEEFKWFDPEKSPHGGSGYNSFYPLVKVITAGLNINF